MFFTPVLRGLRLAGHRVFILCLSQGNFYGQGPLRVMELRQAISRLGLSDGDLTVLDYDRLQDGQSWDLQAAREAILRQIQVLSVDCVISFDGYGISGHQNHISCFSALQSAYTRGLIPEDVQIFVLESVSLVRKYIGLFDSLLSVVHSPYRYFAWGRDVYACWKAMCAHWSQFVWFRVLFIFFSRYTYLNTLRRIHPQKHSVKKKIS